MKKHRRWGRLCLANAVSALLLVLLAFGISNLFLMSRWGREFIAARIARVLPLEPSLQGATWSPWNGVTLYGLRIEQPGALRDVLDVPLVGLRELRLKPDWGELLRKRIALRQIEIVRADVTLPVELLSGIPQADAPPSAPAIDPALASANPPMPAVIAQDPTTALPATVPPAVVQGPIPVPVTPPEATTPTVLVNLLDMRVRIVATGSEKPLFLAAGITGGIPVSGKTKRSSLTVRRLAGPLGEVGKTLLPLTWKSPVLSLGPTEMEIYGMDLHLVCNAVFKAGIPFRIEALVPEQKDRKLSLGPMGSATVGNLAAKGMLQGALLMPGTWQGQCVGRVASVDADLGDGVHAHFGHGQALAVFRKGVLRCPDARLIGDKASLLANAALLSDGRLAGNARLVAAPDSLAGISRFTMPRAAQPPTLTPLGSTQRAALDMMVYGMIGNILYKPHPTATPIRLH